MNASELKTLVLASLESLKAVNIEPSPCRQTDIADYMIIASGTSDRHLHALAGKIHDDSKAAGHPPLGIEGEDSRDWVLVDLGDIIVHLMRPETRELYALEKLWSLPPTRA